MKKIAVVLVTLATVAGVVAGFGYPWYRKLRERRAIGQAQHFLKKEDWTNAWLAARQALQLNSANLDACRIMGDFAERSRWPTALLWRKRLVELSPTLTNSLKLAACALRF